MYNILICDDQKDIVNALKIYLTPEGYQLFTAYTGEEAVAIVKKENIHLILLDVMMPVLDGITFLKKLRENNRFNSIKVIMVSAVSESEEVEKAHSLGADAYITKPVQATLLYESIAELLETA